MLSVYYLTIENVRSHFLCWSTPSFQGRLSWGGGLAPTAPIEKLNFLFRTSGVCKWNRKRSPFMLAKLSIGDIMATEMHASDAYTIIQL